MRGKHKAKDQEIFNSIITIFKDLHKKYPHQGIARHFSDATAEYKNIWGLENKELLFLLEKYQTELSLNITSEEEVNKIIEDSKNLTFNEEDEDIESNPDFLPYGC